MSIDLTEGVVFILRKTSLTLTDIGNLTPTQYNALLKELLYQENLEEYKRLHSVASVLAAIYNTIPKKSGYKALTAKDFLAGDMPSRAGKKETANLERLAIAKGIKLPKER